jgi:hypothetical protein
MLLNGALSQVDAAVIANGSFETPQVPASSNPQFNYQNFLVGSNLDGWTVVGVDSALVRSDDVQSGITFRAQEGFQWIDLAGITSNNQSSGVTQAVATTVGQAYEISFYVGSSTDDVFFFPSTVDLSIDGASRLHFTNPNTTPGELNWMQFTIGFTAQDSSTSITFYNGSAANNFQSALDNVTIAEIDSPAVPEPATLTIWSLGALGCAAAAYRRRKLAG